MSDCCLSELKRYPPCNYLFVHTPSDENDAQIIIIHHLQGGVVLFLLNITFYLAMGMVVKIMGVCELRERDKCQKCKLIELLHQLNLVVGVERRSEERACLVPKMLTGCIYALFVMNPQSKCHYNWYIIILL